MRPTHRPPLLRKSDGFRQQKIMVLPESLLLEAAASSITSGLYVTDIGYFHEAEHHYRDRPEGCDSHILMYCTQGSGWYALDHGKTCKVQPGNLIILPAQVPHVYGANTEEPWSIFWFHLRGEHAHAYIDSLLTQGISTMPPAKAQRWLELFHECYGALETGYSLQTMTFASQIVGYMLGLLTYGSHNVVTDHAAMSSKQAAEQSVQYMLEHLESGVTLKELAAHARLSVPHYSQVFKQVTGHSPIDYFLRLKIQHSCRYLDFTDWTVKQISSELGFSDPYYFSRLFSKMMGRSPTDYRNQSKG